MFIPIQFGEVQSVQFLPLEELLGIAEKYNKKAHVLAYNNKRGN